VKYLLDVNALLAWWHADAEDHAAFHAWAAKAGFQSLATCALAELGFIQGIHAGFRLLAARGPATRSP